MNHFLHPAFLGKIHSRLMGIRSSMNGLSVYGLIGWVLAGVGVCFILVGVFARRIVIRSQPHCGGCGYPLSDVPMTNGVVVCPECGRTPKNATECYTMRQKHWPIIVGLVLFVGSLGVPQIPTMRSGGWTAALPISIQIPMWPTGDNRLRSRIHDSYLDGSLSPSQTRALHSELSEVLSDPETPPNLLSALIPYFRDGTKGKPIFNEDDLEAALLESSNLARRSILIFSRREGIPQSQGLRHARRMVAMDPEDPITQSKGIEWLLSAPSDDSEDRDAIVTLITDESRYTTRNTQQAFGEADHYTLEITASLLDSDHAPTRSRALRCFEYFLRRSRNELPDEIALRIAQGIDDPDPSVRRIAIDMVDDLPESTVPFFDQRLRAIADPEVLDLLIHKIIRMDPDPAGLTPALAHISRNTELELPIRLQAADAYTHINRRARVEKTSENLWPAYEVLVDSLIDEDYELTFLLGQNLTRYTNNWTITALARQIISEGVAPEELDQWFADHPGILTLLRIWESFAIESDTPQLPVERYHHLLLVASKEHRYSVDLVTEAASDALGIHFPLDPIPEPDP